MSTLGFLRPNRYKIFVTITLFTLLFILGVASITNRFLGGGSFDIVNYIVFPLPMIFNFDLTYIFSLAFFVEILYLVILSYLISCILFFIIKKTIIIKNYKISTKKIALLSISILLIVFLLFITIQIIGGAPNYIYLEVRDAQSKELIHNISLQFFYWKGNIFGHDPCIKNIKLSDGKLNEISPISVGFSAYFDDERYYKNYIDFKSFRKNVVYLTKKDSVNKLPGNYETGLLNTWQPGFNEFFGCINIKSVGFDFSQGRQESDLTKADIILDINCTTLTFNNFEKKLDNANIMALGNAGIVDMGNQHTFYSLVNAPKEGYMLKVPLEQSHKYYIRTREGNYAKIEIYWTESSFSDSGYFVKFPIFWAYQSDGSTNLAVEDSYALPFFVKSTCSTFSFTP